MALTVSVSVSGSKYEVMEGFCMGQIICGGKLFLCGNYQWYQHLPTGELIINGTKRWNAD